MEKEILLHKKIDYLCKRIYMQAHEREMSAGTLPHDEEERVNMLELSYDLQLHLLCFLERSDLDNVLATCKSLRALAYPDHLPLLKARLLHKQQLCEAARYGFVDIVRHMLDIGVDVHANEELPLIWACMRGHVEVARLLLERGADPHTLFGILLFSCKYGHVEVARLLLECGADIHVNDGSPLLLACEHGHVELACLLLERVGADVFGSRELTYQCIRTTIVNGHRDVADLLHTMHDMHDMRVASQRGQL